jgi:tRNA threonylcarbamoyladenosine biosynthesis protein TsaB
MTSREFSAERILTEGARAGPVLGVDTGGPIASLGLVADGQLRASHWQAVGSHCADLPAAVDQVVAAAGMKLRDLAGIAVAIGPGSFTGLRIGLSYAKGLVAASRLALIGVPSLDAIALCTPASVPSPGVQVLAMLDARKGEIYTALYRFVDDALQKSTGDLVVPFADFVGALSGKVFFIGDGKAEEACRLARLNEPRVMSAGFAKSHLRGVFVAALGAAGMIRNETADPATLEPLYVRPPGAANNPIVEKSGEGDYGTSRGRTGSAACGS